MKRLYSLFKSLCIAFSMYSVFPTPQFSWKKEDMRFSLLFFPFVGLVIAFCEIIAWKICLLAGVDGFFLTAMLFVIPILLSGGIHADGFLDTIDALHSYQEREKRLEILKDPHVGAFAVIGFGLYVVLQLGFLSRISDFHNIVLLSIGFYLSRLISGWGAANLPNAKGSGLLFSFTNAIDYRLTKIGLVVQLILCMGGMLWWDWKRGSLLMIMHFIWYCRYVFEMKKKFGGITGDTAGYYLVMAETLQSAGIALLSLPIWEALF